MRVLIHAPDPEAVTRARNNARNLLNAAPDAEVRILANAGGVAAVLDAPQAETDQLTLLCENTLGRIGRSASGPLQTVPSSIVALVTMQQDGWIYVRA
jgi:NitT/TauT family transport system ATP-binding protein